MEKIMQYLPLFVPILMIQLGLMLFGLIDLVRREKTRGPKWVWALVIVFVNLIGPIIYFVAGRKDE